MERETHRYLRPWRKRRGLTQDQVVEHLAAHHDDKLPTSKPQLSKIENGKSPYNQRLLEALAEIYDCEVWELVGRDPTKPAQVVQMLPHLSPQQLDQVEAYISGLSDAKPAA